MPFAVEEKTGTISVVETITNFDRTDYEFEAVATDNRNMIISTNVTIHVVYSDSSQTLTKYVTLIAKFTLPQFLSIDARHQPNAVVSFWKRPPRGISVKRKRNGDKLLINSF